MYYIKIIPKTKKQDHKYMLEFSRFEIGILTTNYIVVHNKYNRILPGK